ncbi:putative ABC transporter permease subunit [Virgibacillus sediminis]|uniref:ABC-2 type transport system permease protein n=1 Tax=Virgibacillus sediminis TaxID=202260 RepID=A0ABV7A4Q6_9BACI
MRNTWLLTKTILKMQYSRAGKSSSQLWLYALAAVFLLPMSLIYLSVISSLVGNLYDILAPIGQEQLLLGMLFLLIHLLLFLVGFITIIGAFYFSDDIASFIHFPFQPYQLLTAKAANPFIYMYVISAALYFPAFFAYGAASGASLLFYIYGLILYLFMPLIPFTAASLILMVLMRFINISKNKDRSRVIGGTLSLAVIILINVLVRINTGSDPIQQLAGMIERNDNLLKAATSFYPPSYISAMVLGSAASLSGFLYFLLQTGISLAAAFLFIWAGQRLYLKGALGIGGGSRRNSSRPALSKKVKSRPVWWAYIIKELRLIFRTPAFFMQGVIQSLFAPVFILVLFIFDFGDNPLGVLGGMFNEKEWLLLLFIIGLFTLSGNGTSISSISREGKDWHANLFLPLHMKQVLFSKIAAAWIINLLGITLVLILGILIGAPLSILPAWLVIMFTASWFTSMLGTYLDFLSPKLNWTEEQEVFKSRMTGLFLLVFSLGPLGLLVLLLWHIPIFQGLFPTSVLLMGSLLGAVFLIQQLLNQKLKTNHQQFL